MTFIRKTVSIFSCQGASADKYPRKNVNIYLHSAVFPAILMLSDNFIAGRAAVNIVPITKATSIGSFVVRNYFSTV